MIVSAEFKNFRALRDLKIDLEPFTVIVGPNSCGKSTILEGLKWLVGSKEDELYHLKNSVSKGATDELQIIARVKNSQNIFLDYQIAKYHILITSKRKASGLSSVGEYARTFTGKMIMLNPNAKAMAQASYGASLNPIIDSDGRGLATICTNLQLSYPDIFNKIQNQIRRVIPSLKQFRMKPAETTNYIGGHERIGSAVFGDELVFDFENDPNIPANRVGDGILVSLCVLIVAMRTSQEPFLLLIDNLERGLHPMTTQDLANALRDLQKEFPNLQIVATTHSTYLLDAFEVKEVRVAALDPQLGTVVACLNEAPDFEKWNAVLETGELWSYMGESWVLGQKHMDALVKKPV